MTNIKTPLIYTMEKNDAVPFTGKSLVTFLQDTLEKVTGESMPTAYSLNEIESYFLSDEQGKEFWTKQLSVFILETELKKEYNIDFRDNDTFLIKQLRLIIENIELFELGVTRLLDDLIDPSKKYLLYRRFMKPAVTMTFEERLAAAVKESEELARELKEKRGY